MSNRSIYLLIISIALLLAGFIYLFIKILHFDKKMNEPVTEEMTFVEGMNYAMPVALPDTIAFAGELAPLDIYYVREYLDRELTVNTYWHSSTLLMLKRAHRWFPVIEPVLAQQGVPDDFKYLALVESGFLNVISPSGAAGFWQFLEATGKEYGLTINKEVDERYHLVKATLAACSYLKKSYAKFGNWTLVAASYNAGQNRVEEFTEKQYTRNYYQMYVSEETSRYVFRILAIKTIFVNPQKFGFKLKKGDLYDPLDVKTIKVLETIKSLPEFARENKVSYRMLKELNPWLRSDKLTVRRGEEYSIFLPKD